MNEEKQQSSLSELERDWHSYWSDRPRQFGETDFLRQVERTVAGQPAEEGQTRMTVEAVTAGLALVDSDFLVDLCCGNGLLTRSLGRLCRRTVGIDFSEPLIAVAQKHNASPQVRYLRAAAAEIATGMFGEEVPTKISMCAGLQHFSVRGFRELIKAIDQLGVERVPVYFTDVPDQACLRAFYDTPQRWAEYEARRQAGTEAIGTWWSRESLVTILAEFGYRATIVEQDPLRSTAHYRFDLLARAEDGS